MSAQKEGRKPDEDGAAKNAKERLSIQAVAAEQYAARGLSIFPVHTVSPSGVCSCEKSEACGQPGKHPRIGQWQVKSTSDEATVRQWWTRWPEANIGLHVGKSSLVVIDIDPRNGGVETFETLETKHGPVRAVVESITGGNGRHLFFEASPGDGKLPARLGGGIDLQRGDKYVILPPSRHKSGRPYVWRAGFDLASNANMLTYLPAWVKTRNTAIVPSAPREESGALADVIDLLYGTDWEEEKERAFSALECCPMDTRADYYEKMMIFKSESGDDPETKERFREVCINRPKYIEEHFERDWQSASSKPGGVGLGTLFKIAKENGWQEKQATDVASIAHPEHDFGGAIDLARMFAEMFHGEFLCIYGDKQWAHWTDRRWELCRRGEERQAAEKVLEAAVGKAMIFYGKHPKSEDAKQAFFQAVKMRRSNSAITAILEHAASIDRMNIHSIAVFDRNPELIGCRNGVVDMRSMRLIPATREQLISRQAEASFVLEATCPMWLRTLDQVCMGDHALLAFFQRFCGYVLTGYTSEEKLLYLWGPGGNGKSVVCNVLSAIAGDYAGTVSHELLVKKLNNGEARHILNRLQGLRLALMNEVPKGATFDGQRLKEVTSHDRIAARENYGKAYDFEPSHKLVLRGNYRLTVHDTDDGFWDRMLLVELAGRFRGATGEVRDLHSVLVEKERDGIFMWMLEGARDYLRERHLLVPKSISAAVNSYRKASDVLSEWFEERCIRGVMEEVPYHAAFENYKHFMEAANMKPMARNTFSTEMTSRVWGFGRRQSNGITLLTGFRLREPGEQDDFDL